MQETGSKEEILASITDPENWIGSNTERVPFPPACFRDALPVELLSFKVIALNGCNTIEFVTAGEDKVFRYEIQRSENGEDFYFIANISPLNGIDLTKYSYQDFNDKPGFYRLKEINIDDKATYFRSVYSSLQKTEIVQFCIYDLIGKTYKSGSLITEELSAQILELERGQYILKMITESGSITKLIVKE